tara:strand:+ start:92 stop:883 length:792 start_codon:yes stop_codon:yes gene_type:complete
MIIKTSRFNVIPDRHTAEEIDNLSSPLFGVQVFDTTNQLLKFWNGNVWENAGSGSVSVGQRAANYSALQDGTVDGEIAYCNLPQGTQWLPGTIGGDFYPAGWYLWNGTIWTSDRNNIVNQLQLNVNGLGGKSDIGHTHVKATITDFSDSDYATEEQGVLADASIQPDDNISELTNDSEFINLADLGIDGLEDYYDELIYLGGLLITVETYEDNSKAVNLFTKSFTYTGGVLTQIALLNIATNVTETKTLSYDISGNLINITKA